MAQIASLVAKYILVAFLKNWCLVRPVSVKKRFRQIITTGSGYGFPMRIRTRKNTNITTSPAA